MADISLVRERGRYIARLAQGESEMEALHRLRYDIYYTEKGNAPEPEAFKTKMDRDSYDDYATQMVIVDQENDDIIATHRLIFQDDVPTGKTFYSEEEFDLSKLLGDGSYCMEIGRACIKQEHRRGFVLSIMWKYTMEIIKHKGVTRMFGCGSFLDINPEVHQHTLSYLYHNHLAPDHLMPEAKDPSTTLNLLSPEDIDQDKALEGVPPLMKGYLNLGGRVGGTAFLDHAFNMLDVLIFVDADNIPDSSTLNRITK